VSLQAMVASARAFWSELPSPLRILLSHAFYCAVTDLSFIALFWLARWVPLGRWPAVILDTTEQIMVVGVTVYFTLITLYDLTQERLRAIVRSFSGHSVLA
jgi:hypothetical protein